LLSPVTKCMEDQEDEKVKEWLINECKKAVKE
jgi:hypothetical protein